MERAELSQVMVEVVLAKVLTKSSLKVLQSVSVKLLFLRFNFKVFNLVKVLN